MNIFKRLRAALRLDEAIRQADKAHEETGNRYYVIPNGNSGKLIIMDRKNFRKLKQKHYLSHEILVHDLELGCFYCTPYRDGNGTLPEKVIKLKRAQYFNYLSELENRKKKNGKQVRQEARD